MSDSSNQATLELCNLTSQGMTVKEAQAHIDGKKEFPVDKVSPGAKPMSAADRKQLLKEQIEEIGYEAPELTASVAKFEQALEAAKADLEEDHKKKELESQASDPEVNVSGML